MNTFHVLVLLLVSVTLITGSDVMLQPLDGTGDVGIFSSVATEPSTGLLSVAYTKLGAAGVSELRFLRCQTLDCSAFTTKVLASGTGEGYHPSLAYQVTGTPVITYSQGAQANVSVSMIVCRDEACDNRQLYDMFTPEGFSSPGWTSVAIVQGKPTIAFVGNLGTEAIVAVWTLGSTNKAAIVHKIPKLSVFQWGSDRNMAAKLGSGNPYIAVYADGVGLQLIICSSADCRLPSQVRTLDEATFRADVGLYASVVVHPTTGLAVVAYHDATSRALRMIFCQDLFCLGPPQPRVFPSTYAWDPSVIVDPQTLLPKVAYGDPSISNVVIMACQDAECEQASFSNLLGPNATSVDDPHRFESVKLASTGAVVAHDSVTNKMFALVLPGSDGSCADVACTVEIVITSPQTSPATVGTATVSIAGFVTPASTDITVQINNGSPIAVDPSTGNFTASIALVEGSNVVTVLATNSTGQVVGATSVIVVSATTLPGIEITIPSANDTSTFETAILVRGTASPDGGLDVVTLYNAATNVTVTALTATPVWSALMGLATRTRNVITATARDRLGREATATVSIFQSGLTAQITCPNNITLECSSSALPLAAARVINCDEPVVTTTTAEVTCGGAQVVSRRYSACGVSCVQELRVQDTTAPVIQCPAATMIACNAPVPQPAVTDSCPGIVPPPVMRPATLDCSQDSAQSVTFVVTDGCGNTASCSFPVTVEGSGPVPPTTLGTVSTTTSSTESPGLSGAGLGGLIAGIILLLLILLLTLLLGFCWLRKKKRRTEESQINVPIMMDAFDEELSSSSVTASKLYKPHPTNQSSESQDFADVF